MFENYTKLLRNEIDQLKSDMEGLNKNLLIEKKAGEVYSRFYNNAKAIIHEDAQTQTHEDDSIEFVLFNELVTRILNGRTLKASRLNTLMFDFMKFKSDLTSKINHYFSK